MMEESLKTDDMQRIIASTWWVILLHGIAVLILGMLLLTSPAKTLAALITFLGIYWVISGAFSIIAVLAGHIQEHKGWVIVSGVISVIAGFVVMRNVFWSSMIVPTVAAIIIAVSALINGVVMIAAGRPTDGARRQRSWGSFFLGLLYIIIAILLLSRPLLGAVTLIWVAAIWGIVGGILLIVFAFKVKKLVQ